MRLAVGEQREASPLPGKGGSCSRPCESWSLEKSWLRRSVSKAFGSLPKGERLARRRNTQRERGFTWAGARLSPACAFKLGCFVKFADGFVLHFLLLRFFCNFSGRAEAVPRAAPCPVAAPVPERAGREGGCRGSRASGGAAAEICCPRQSLA